MKPNLHPHYQQVVFRDRGAGLAFRKDDDALRERGAALPESVYTAQQLHEAVLALLRKGGRD